MKTQDDDSLKLLNKYNKNKIALAYSMAKMLVVQKGLSAYVSETLSCQVLTSGISQDDLILFTNYNLPGEWQQLMMMSCAFLLSPKQKRSTLFIHGGVDIGKRYFCDAFSFASGEENTGNFCWNPLIDHHFFVLQDDQNINLSTSSEIETIKRVLGGGDPISLMLNISRSKTQHIIKLLLYPTNLKFGLPEPEVVILYRSNLTHVIILNVK